MHNNDIVKLGYWSKYKTMISCGADGSIVVWNIETGYSKIQLNQIDSIDLK